MNYQKLNSLINDSSKLWLIDVDETLYKSESLVTKILKDRYTYYFSYKLRTTFQKAKDLNNYLYTNYSNSITGAIKEKIISVNDVKELSVFVHNIELSNMLIPNEKILSIVKAAKGEKVIFSNSVNFYIQNILKLLNVQNEFSKIFDINSFNLICKPNIETFEHVQNHYNKDYKNFVLIDDSQNCLTLANKLGMSTINSRLL